jgi:Asp-tRNAAsn/Glu-tRNAGln amidotransferase A subunit and related amidases
MAPLSIGSQTGGSVIRPASYCGVVGYKPSYGLISRNGVLRTSYHLDHIGVFGKTVEDVALLAKVLIKKDSYDKATIHYSSRFMLEECEKRPMFDPNLFFIKLKVWKKLIKNQRESLEFFIKSSKKNI